jgi:hypothetical protein
MAEIQFKLSGWQAIVVLIGFVIVRLATFSDKRGDADLLQELEFQLMTEYFPDDVANLEEVYESGDEEELDEAVESITSTELTIISVQTSSPLLSFKSNEKVIVKVVYSLDDAYDNRQKGTKYYRFQHGALGNTWRYRYNASIASYYLNCI